jgi:hypothetical protein
MCITRSLAGEGLGWVKKFDNLVDTHPSIKLFPDLF